MTSFGICNVIVWLMLIVSWVSPYFIQDKQKARALATILSAVAVGMALCNMIWLFTK